MAQSVGSFSMDYRKDHIENIQPTSIRNIKTNEYNTYIYIITCDWNFKRKIREIRTIPAPSCRHPRIFHEKRSWIRAKVSFILLSNQVRKDFALVHMCCIAISIVAKLSPSWEQHLGTRIMTITSVRIGCTTSMKILRHEINMELFFYSFRSLRTRGALRPLSESTGVRARA